MNPVSFEQEASQPLLHVSEPEPLVSQSSEPTFEVTCQKHQLTSEFLQEMQLNYSEKEISAFSQEISSYIFFLVVKIKENGIKWEIRKRVQDIVDLDAEIRHYLHKKGIKDKNLPVLKIKDEKIPPKQISDEIQNYLEDLLLVEALRANHILYLFLEFSNTRLETTSAQKIKETYVNKRAGGRFNENKILLKCASCFSCCLCWKKRYLIITSEGVLLKLEHMSTGEFRENLSFDHHYSLKYGLEQTGLERGLILCYSSRKLHIEALDTFSFFDLLYSLILAFASSSYSNPPRYGSFAPIRENSTCEWYIDGQGYFEAVYKHLKHAKIEVFITDWWLSPELPLVRPVSKAKNEETRINNLLRTLAENDVKIYVIIYREQAIALANDSAHTKRVLRSMHPNIKVLRHPNHPFFLWSHHEKIVVIDQKYGFLGGLDLCYGRMDTKHHHLHDPHFAEGKGEEFFPGIDFTNSRIRDFFAVKEHAQARISKDSIPRMPWHDIAVRVEGDPVVDLCRHFIQYWNFAKYDLNPDRKAQDVLITKGFNALEYEQDEDDRFNAYVSGIKERRKPTDKLVIPEVNDEEKDDGGKEKDDGGKEKDNGGKDNNERLHSKSDKSDKLMRKAGTSLVPRGKKIDFRKIHTAPSHHTLDQIETSKEFITLIENMRKKQMDANGDNQIQNTMPLIPSNAEREELIEVKKYNDLLVPERQYQADDEDDILVFGEQKPSIRQRFQNWSESLLFSKPSSEIAPTLQKYRKEDLKISSSEEKIKGKKTDKAKCQILRSASNWSIGLKVKNHESSIMNAYMAMILAAEHFIYIENQFFISLVETSKSASTSNPVINEIANALYIRIKRAAKEGKKFKVIVVMPLLPGFEGDIYAPNSALLKIQLHYEYQTISRGGLSLMERLFADPNIQNPEDYISFYGLRNHTVMNGKPVTEIIYVHSKLIIVDDKYTLIGSANINDRSMLGDRDSEIAILVEDQNMIASRMDGIRFHAGEFSHSLRTNIFMEHFGLTYDQVKDPLSQDFLNTITTNTETNTFVYREIFGCYPDDTIKKADKSSMIHVQEPNLEIYNILKEKIVGHAVQFPLKFLCEENLKFKLMAKERILPDHNFT